MKKRRINISMTLVAASWLMLSCIASGCATAVPASKKTIQPPRQDTFARVELPSEINAGNVFELEATAFSLKENNPERHVVRDEIVKYRMTVFLGLADDDTEGRLAQFRLILALHDPSDFRSGNVSVAAAPMAEWVVKEFEPQGKEALVLAGLAYLSMAYPDDAKYEKRLMALLEWSEKVRDTIRDPIERYGSISAMYGDAATLVPHWELLNRLAVSLAARQRAVVQFLQMFAGQKGGFSPLMFHSVISRGGIGKEFVHAWFMGGYLNEVLNRMKELEVIDGIEEDLLAVLSQLQEEKNMAYNYHRLASQILGPGDPVAGMRACMNALHLNPKEPRYSLCVGRFLSNMDRQVAAVDYFARAVQIDSGPSMVQAMELVQDSLYRLHVDENRDEMRAALSTTEKIVELVTEKAGDDEEISFAAAALIETAAIIEYDDGEIDIAEKWFEMAYDLWPSRPTPITKIAEIYYWRGEYLRAVEYLTQAMNARDKPGGAYADYWRAMLYEQRGDCHAANGNIESAKADYAMALKRWETADYPLEQSPVIAIRQGVLFSRLGDIEKSMDKFREAVQLAPDRRATYAEVISFLVVNERLSDAEEFYRLAFNQDMLAAMWKVYFSIWVDGLSRLNAGKSFDLALGYLENTPSESWQDKLASYFIGAIDSATLRKEAVNKGQHVEADYYEALRLTIDGRQDQAEPLLKKVIASRLFAFFEYRMAAELLKKNGNGAKKNDATSGD